MNKSYGRRKKYRYPGINPFETSDTDIFFGRDEDQRKLTDLVEVEKSTLLYSSSSLAYTKSDACNKCCQKEKSFHSKIL